MYSNIINRESFKGILLITALFMNSQTVFAESDSKIRYYIDRIGFGNGVLGVPRLITPFGVNIKGFTSGPTVSEDEKPTFEIGENISETGMRIYKGSVCNEREELNKLGRSIVSGEPPHGENFFEYNSDKYKESALFSSSNGNLRLVGGVRRHDDLKFLEKVIQIFPKSILANISFFRLFSDPNVRSSASVTGLQKENLININLANFNESSATADQKIIDLTHEMCHIVHNRKKHNIQAGSICRGYLSEMGGLRECFASNSPVTHFHRLFWIKSGEEIPECTDDNYNDTNSCMWNYVTGYARKNPVEDFADTCAFYVLKDFIPRLQKEKDIVKRKINFMDSWPEMRQFKKEVLEKLKNSDYLCEQ